MVNRVQKKFARGDKVFAKVRGHPPWPAKIEGVTEDNTKHAKYNVFFYGTRETAMCKLEELFEYAENKEKFRLKAMKRKNFLDGMEQLEEELKNDSPSAAPATKEKKAVVAAEEPKKVISQVEPVTVDSDAELGNLVIDEGEKKKPMKRKSMASVNTPDAPEAKKKRGRPKENTPKQDVTVESPGDESQEKEVISRSGRKIKPKRFADSDGVETEKTEHHQGRGRPRKTEEAIEGQNSTPAAVTKKRMTAERKSNVGELPSDAIIKSSTADKIGRFLNLRAFSGEYVGIKLDLNRPQSFANEKAQDQWEAANYKKALKLKAQLESGEIFPDQVKDRLDFNVLVLDGKRPSLKDGSNQQNFKLKWLRVEAQLLELDAQIKANLGLDKANADPCLLIMDVMFNLPIDPLMLKKHPQIVETIKRLRRYIGNLSDWQLSDDETIIFKEKADQIRQKAENIYNKFKALFTIPEGQTFWQSFSDHVENFKELTKGMPEEKMFSLIDEPVTANKKTDSDVSFTTESVGEVGSIVKESETIEDKKNEKKNSTPVGSESK